MNIYNELYDNLWTYCETDEFKAQYVAYNVVNELITGKRIEFNKNWFNERLRDFNDKHLIESWIERLQEKHDNDYIINYLTDYYKIAFLEYLHSEASYLLTGEL